MITLNLISQAQKEANRFQKNYTLAKGMMLILLIALTISVGFLLMAKTLLQNRLTSLTQETQILKRQSEEEKKVDLEQTVKDFNKLLNNLDDLQAKYTNWSEILIKTSSLIPSGIKLTSFNLKKDTAEFKFTGLANTRDTLLLFKNNLEKSDILTDIQSPISNLLSKENINFDLSGKLKLEPGKLD